MVSLRSRPFLPPGKRPVSVQFKAGWALELEWKQRKGEKFCVLACNGNTISFLSSLRSSRYSDRAISAPSVIDTVRSFQHFRRKLGTSFKNLTLC
jgi:hypothetical protein